jgi:putative membrane protein
VTVLKTMGLLAGATLAGSWFGCASIQRVLPGVTLSDANMVSVLDRLDENEIAAARLAQAKASAAEVQAFAGRILNEHRESVEASWQLATELSLQPVPSALASDLKQAHEQAMEELRMMSGPAFDRAYLRYEIQQHVRAFTFLEAAAESETNVTLKQELIRTGPDLLSHISAARALQRHLGLEPQDAIALR